jgi:hypothetical protein
MDANALHLELRNALSLADELSRHAYSAGNAELSTLLSVVRTAISEREVEVGQSHLGLASASPLLIQRITRSLAAIRDQSEAIPLVQRPRFTMLMESLERIVFAEQHPLAPVPAQPLFGKLPLARAIPQDVHSVADYLIAGTYLASAMFARTKWAKRVGIAMGVSAAGVALASDHRLSLTKAIRIETHELIDHAFGIRAVALPVIFGYVRKDPIAAGMQIVAGIGTIALALFTDYRGDRGTGRALRSKGGPTPVRDRLPHNVKNRVPEAQRPLEGLSGAI